MRVGAGMVAEESQDQQGTGNDQDGQQTRLKHRLSFAFERWRWDEDDGAIMVLPPAVTPGEVKAGGERASS